MRVADLAALPGLRLRLLTEAGLLDQEVRRVYTTDLPDPGRYLSGGELVLTGLIWCREPGDAGRFAAAVAAAGAAALAAGEALGEVPQELVSCCARLGLPLFAVPAETSFGTVTDEVIRRLSADRAGAMTRALGRRRRLLSAVTEGAGIEALFRMVADDIGPGCWLITAVGRLLAGTGDPLPARTAVRLAAEYLAAGGRPAAVKAGGVTYSLLPAAGPAGLTGWFLACTDAGQDRGADPDRADEAGESIAELAADVALERARLDSGLRGERRLGEQIVARLAAGDASPAEVTVLLRAADLPPDGRYLALAAVAGIPGSGAGPGPGLVEELVLPYAGRAAIAEVGSETLALVPDQEPAVAGDALLARVREAEPALRAGLRGGRLTIGVSSRCSGVDGLAEALREARGARRLAELRPGSVCVVTGDELGTHAMLLASVPGDVLRSFRGRLLGPLLGYDRRRHAELVPTLAEFLACSGSWNACAARLHVHVNTLRYRIRRIEELTGRDLSTLDDQVDFFLALAGREHDRDR
ncbi:MAG TPA: PucR family transcriptional regulator ligand-binding domain-containing protein [Streptosporangiaceae bacterium]